jgi:hypothetical protein
LSYPVDDFPLPRKRPALGAFCIDAAIPASTESYRQQMEQPFVIDRFGDLVQKMMNF